MAPVGIVVAVPAAAVAPVSAAALRQYKPILVLGVSELFGTHS